MPLIAVVNGIRIELYYNDQSPPHFHAKQAGDEILVEIARLRVFGRRGGLSAGQERTVLDWAVRHQAELALCWARTQTECPAAGNDCVMELHTITHATPARPDEAKVYIAFDDGDALVMAHPEDRAAAAP